MPGPNRGDSGSSKIFAPAVLAVLLIVGMIRYATEDSGRAKGISTITQTPIARDRDVPAKEVVTTADAVSNASPPAAPTSKLEAPQVLRDKSRVDKKVDDDLAESGAQSPSNVHKLSILLLRQSPTPTFKAMLDDILLKDGRALSEENYRRLANVILALQDGNNISGYAILTCLHGRSGADDKMDLAHAAALCATMILGMYGEGVRPEGGKCPVRYHLRSGECLRDSQ